jgi:hypothetical protein
MSSSNRMRLHDIGQAEHGFALREVSRQFDFTILRYIKMCFKIVNIVWCCNICTCLNVLTVVETVPCNRVGGYTHLKFLPS